MEMEKLRATAAGLAEILYMRAVPDMQTLGYAFPHLSRRSLQNLIKAFSEGLLQRAISYRRMRVFGVFLAASDETMCSILFPADLSLSGSAPGTDADKSNFSLIWWKSDTPADMVNAP